MTDPVAQAAKQLANIEADTGMTLAQFTAAIAETGLDRHGKILAHLKSEYGLTHGNANLLSARIREQLAGGPAGDDELLDAQYSGARAGLRPIYETLAELAGSVGTDVGKVVQKTGVSFRRNRQFALVQAPSSKRVQLGLKLDTTPDDPRVKETSGMCSHRVDITDPSEVDDDVAGWLRMAYDQAG